MPLASIEQLRNSLEEALNSELPGGQSLATRWHECRLAVTEYAVTPARDVVLVLS